MPRIFPIMNKDFRERVFVPVIMPVGAFVSIGVIVFAFSRILLAVPAAASASVAFAVALNVVIVASMVVAIPFIRPGRIRSLMFLGATMLTAGGIWAASAGYWPTEHEEKEAAAHAAEKAAEAAAGPMETTKFDLIAQDIAFDKTALDAVAGKVEFDLRNGGQIPHTLVIEDVEGFKLDVATAGATDSGSVTVEAGSYTFYCDVPGHREAGMQGTLTVS